MAGPIVIAEIGGSSSRWAVVEEGIDRSFPLKGETLPGFNPLNGDGTLFREAMDAYFTQAHPDVLKAGTVLVYAAGCGSPQRSALVRQALAPLWPGTTGIAVESDLLGAARGLCGRSKGMVLILGTGMNAGFFDGDQLWCPMPSLGWILGDEGSGADLGRTLLQDAFYKRMPEHLSMALFGAEGPALETVLQQVYRSPFPARALAAHTALLVPYLEEAYVRDLIVSRFHAMAEVLTAFFPLEQRAEVNATGSVAWGFRELLAEVLLDRGMTLTVVERDPLPGLVRYHRPG
jgi:N-acetylglucosamine kinase-like BadF-type ATPase